MNDFEVYVELANNPLNKKFKNLYNKVMSFFKTKQEDFYEIMVDRQRKKLYELTTDAPKIIEIIEKATKEIIERNKSNISQQLINEEGEFNPSISDIKKDLIQRVSKGFIPSATFYPAFKMFEQFFMILRKEITLNQINFNLNSNELLAICSSIFIYLFYKIVKESYVLKKEYVAKKIKEKEEKEKIKQRIKKNVDKELNKKLWSQEQMDEWLKQKLWSPQELERMIENKMKEKHLFEDSIFEFYMDKAIENSNHGLAKRFVENIKKFKLPGKNHKIIENQIANILNKLEKKDADKILNSLQNSDIINEEFYSENFIKSLKEFVSEMFPSLTFYPALQSWMLLEKVIGKQNFDALSEAEMNQLKTYIAVFVGLVGVKIAVNRIKDRIESNKVKKYMKDSNVKTKNKKNETQEKEKEIEENE